MDPLDPFSIHKMYTFKNTLYRAYKIVFNTKFAMLLCKIKDELQKHYGMVVGLFLGCKIGARNSFYDGARPGIGRFRQEV